VKSKSGKRYPIHRGPEVPKSIAKSIVIKVEIKPGPASESQKQRYKLFWQKIISAVKADEREGATDTIKESQPRPPQ